MSATNPQHPQSPQDRGYPRHQQSPQDRGYPRYQHGQHVRLSDGTHAQVVAQRGLTLWVRRPDRDQAATCRADTVEPARPHERLSTGAHKPGPRR